MLMEQATTVRKEWSSVCDSVVHNKPKFIKRTRDKMWFSNLETIEEILKAYKFSAEKFIEEIHIVREHLVLICRQSVTEFFFSLGQFILH